jgi:NAD(P)-dependent dehydrogenase (short-subunit alcohol dehydrogenase family)
LQAILWLASAEASFITGAFLDVAGGKCATIRAILIAP